MILEPGDKIHVITRRAFDGDIRRHFVGEVSSAGETTARAEGYAFVFNLSRNEFARRPELRERLVALSDARNLIHVLPPDVELAQLEYRTEANRLYLTDGKQFRLDVNEFGAQR